MTRSSLPLFPALGAFLLLSAFLSGCLLVRTTEHRVRINQDGSGDAVLRLIDIRSDGVTDSATAADLRTLVQAFSDSGGKEFERHGRRVTSKRLVTQADTLSAEVTYTFSSIASLEGFRVTHDELSVVVPTAREIVRTNGSVRESSAGTKRIVWERDTQRLFYVIRERSLPASIPLGRMYRSLQ
jgi:hypothetical protein